MSGLAAVLAGRHAPGVHRWESGLDVADVRRAVEHAGWRFGYADTLALDASQPVLRVIGDAVGVADHFAGRSLDAFNDVLRDLAGPTVLLWEGWSGFARAEPARFELVVEVLAQRGEADPAIEVLLRGPGPQTGLPLLS
ncbi:barstar family protein [Nocardioides sp. BYT-33-1]|uniref:barstar family protein n=1 Tax=Nocardioides sp. BYT-33-1 TaxID=3416952 RepID=UPI003F53871E